MNAYLVIVEEMCDSSSMINQEVAGSSHLTN